MAAEQSYPWSALVTFIHDTDAKLHELSEKAAHAADESTLALYFGLKDIDESWSKTQSKLLEQVDRLNSLEQKAHTAADTARVKAHLAKADALDLVRDLRSRLTFIERHLHGFKVEAESDASHAIKRLAKFCNELARRLDEGPKGDRHAKDLRSSISSR